MEEKDVPLRPDARFAVDVARFVDGRVDPSTNTSPPGGSELDVIAVLEAEEQLRRIVG
jgi:hypothetical protein